MNLKKLFFLLLIVSPIFSKAPIGLQNCGNSCYMNSTIQCLYNLEELTKFVIASNNNFIENSLARAYSNFATLLNSGSIPDGNTIKQVLYNKVGQVMAKSNPDNPNITAERDAGEFTTIILDHIANVDVKSKFLEAHENFMDKNFNLKEASILTCICGVSKTTNVARKFSIEAPIILSSNLQTCLGHYLAGEFIDDFKCPECDEKGVTKTIIFTNVPEYLIISLKRFDNEGNKIDTAVPFPLTNLSLESRIHRDIKLPNNTANYDLTGIVLHGGGTMGGHYVAYVKTGNKWYGCNDSSITQLSDEFMIKFASNTTSEFFTPYLFFYKKSISAPISPTEVDLAPNLTALTSSLSGLKAVL